MINLISRIGHAFAFNILALHSWLHTDVAVMLMTWLDALTFSIGPCHLGTRHRSLETASALRRGCKPSTSFAQTRCHVSGSASLVVDSRCLSCDITGLLAILASPNTMIVHCTLRLAWGLPTK